MNEREQQQWKLAAILKDRTRREIRRRARAGESHQSVADDFGVPVQFVEVVASWQMFEDDHESATPPDPLPRGERAQEIEEAVEDEQRRISTVVFQELVPLGLDATDSDGIETEDPAEHIVLWVKGMLLRASQSSLPPAPLSAQTTAQDVICPFCREGDFDAIGLKLHLNAGHCDAFNAVEVPRG